jgi:hypothetical protein
MIIINTRKIKKFYRSNKAARLVAVTAIITGVVIIAAIITSQVIKITRDYRLIKINTGAGETYTETLLEDCYSADYSHVLPFKYCQSETGPEPLDLLGLPSEN